MAVGFPVKDDYVTGDVLTAANMNDLSGTVNLLEGTPEAAGYAAGKNGIINSAFNVWQRGTSFAIPSSAYTYTADRWIGLRFSTGSTISQQTASLTGFQYSIRVARDSGNTGTGIIYLGYNLETADSYRYAGKTVTLSFYAKAGANFSAASSALAVIWVSGTGTNQKQMDGFTGASTLASSSVTLTTSWQRFSFTAAVPSNSTQQGFQFNYTPVGTAGAADNFEITGVQLEVGSTASDFQTATGTIQGELAACQRYYWRNTPGNTYGTYNCFGLYVATDQWQGIINHPVPMRIAPTTLEYGNLATFDGVTITAAATIAITANQTTTLGTYLANTGISGRTQFRPAFLISNNNTAGYIGLSAEL